MGPADEKEVLNEKISNLKHPEMSTREDYSGGLDLAASAHSPSLILL